MGAAYPPAGLTHVRLGVILITKGADPALPPRALYPSLIFITARQAKAAAAAGKSCRFHSLRRLLCFLRPCTRRRQATDKGQPREEQQSAADDSGGPRVRPPPQTQTLAKPTSKHKLELYFIITILQKKSSTTLASSRRTEWHTQKRKAGEPFFLFFFFTAIVQETKRENKI